MRARARWHRQRSHSVERPCDLYRIFIALTRTWRGYKRLGWVSVGCGARCSCACVFVRFIVNSLGCHTFNLAYRYRDVCTLEVVGSHRIATHTHAHMRAHPPTRRNAPLFLCRRRLALRWRPERCPSESIGGGWGCEFERARTTQKKYAAIKLCLAAVCVRCNAD